MLGRRRLEETDFLYSYPSPRLFKNNDVNVQKSTDWDLLADIISETEQLVVHPTPSNLKNKYENDDHYFFIARINGEVAGMGAVRKMSFYISVNKYLYVREQHRTQGVATALTEHRIEYANDKLSTPLVQCTTITDNVPVRGLCRRVGYRPVGRFKSPMSENLLVLWIYGTTIAGVMNND